MGVACIQISTNRYLEFQSDATPGTLIRNAAAAGFDVADVREVTMDVTAFMAEAPRQFTGAPMVTN